MIFCYLFFSGITAGGFTKGVSTFNRASIWGWCNSFSCERL
nr:MAG TPA: hypothetical protein [Caudoviricetes sp.]